MGDYAAVTDPSDWRAPLLVGATPLDVPLMARNPAGWPGYLARQAVTAWVLDPAVLPGGPVAARWDFASFGGSFGEDDATVLVLAAAEATRRRVPLVTLVRTGGTRLQEGMAALMGIPRARLALLELAAAGLPHLSVADAPTTGGVWISVTSAADLRVAVEGATVGFAGPRVVEAVTGVRPAHGSHTASSAYAAGLVDAVLPAADVPAWLWEALTALTSGPSDLGAVLGEPRSAAPTGRSGWDQVRRARTRTTGGAALLGSLLVGPVALQAPHGDRTVAAAVGRLGGERGRAVVAVALAAHVGVRPSPDGYRLAARAYRLAGRLGLPALSLVDTPGAEPGAAAEDDGIAPAMGEALDALLSCPSPTVALVHGEGGSGGALAAATADLLLLTDDAYFAAIGPEGASAALRLAPERCADLMRITPADLVALGAADAVLAHPAEVVAHLVRLSDSSGADRLVRRRARWSSHLPGQL